MSIGVAQCAINRTIAEPPCTSWLYVYRRCSEIPSSISVKGVQVLRGFMSIGVAQAKAIYETDAIASSYACYQNAQIAVLGSRFRLCGRLDIASGVL